MTALILHAGEPLFFVFVSRQSEMAFLAVPPVVVRDINLPNIIV